VSDLIEALQILVKYADLPEPFVTTENELAVVGIHPAAVSPEDTARLAELGFHVEDPESDDPYFASFRFGGRW